MSNSIEEAKKRHPAGKGLKVNLNPGLDAAIKLLEDKNIAFCYCTKCLHLTAMIKELKELKTV